MCRKQMILMLYVVFLFVLRQIVIKYPQNQLGLDRCGLILFYLKFNISTMKKYMVQLKKNKDYKFPLTDKKLIRHVLPSLKPCIQILY